MKQKTAEKPFVSCIIAAGGRGSRMGAEMNKIFLEFGDKSLGRGVVVDSLVVTFTGDGDEFLERFVIGPEGVEIKIIALAFEESSKGGTIAGSEIEGEGLGLQAVVGNSDFVVTRVDLVGAVLVIAGAVQSDGSVNWGDVEVNGSGLSGIVDKDTNDNEDGNDVGD